MMTKIIQACGIGILLLFISGCKKNNGSGIALGSTVTLSQKTVKLEEPLYAAASNNFHPGSYIRWSVNPSQNSWLSASGNQSVLLFSHSGTYSITANYYTDSTSPDSYDSSSAMISVTDILFNADTSFHCNAIVVSDFSLEEQMLITPVAFTNDDALVLAVHTHSVFSNAALIIYSNPSPDTINNNAYSFNFIENFACVGNPIPSPATAVMVVPALGSGIHPLHFTLSGYSFDGSINVVGNDLTIHWPYTSIITIYPLEISKQ